MIVDRAINSIFCALAAMIKFFHLHRNMVLVWMVNILY